MQQRHRVEVEHGLCLRMVAQLRVVAGEAQNVVDAEHSGAQKVGLERDAVAVAAGQLEDGGKACVLEDLAGGKTAQTHDGRLVIGDVDIVHAGEIFLRLFYQAVDMNSLGGADLSGNYKFSVLKQFRNSHNSSLLIIQILWRPW